MYSRWQLARKYLYYYRNASNGKGHGIHSPFVFDFIINVLNDKKRYDEYKKAESLRSRLLRDSRMFLIEDFGAGSAFLKEKEVSIGSIARHAAKSKKYGQLLFRIIKHYQPRNILELGTSLGITTSYLSLAKPDSNIITVEGSSEIAGIARRNFINLSLSNVELIEGNFDDVLHGVLKKIDRIDLVFIDGNHRKEPTVRYFEQMLPRIGNEAILIFDDIHWSKDMEEAWKLIKEHPATRCTIDFFFIGIVLFRKEFHEKQHFTIRF